MYERVASLMCQLHMYYVASLHSFLQKTGYTYRFLRQGLCDFLHVLGGSIEYETRRWSMFLRCSIELKAGDRAGCP